jgi:hypothetical protein
MHASRLPQYVRLDERLTRRMPLSRGIAILYVEALNLLDRRNVMDYTWTDDYRNARPVHSFFGRRTIVVGAELQR